MTTTATSRPHTPTPTRGVGAKQGTRAARSRRSGWAVLRWATWPIETAAWTTARAIVRYPKSAALLGATLPLVSPVTYREVTAIFLAGSSVVGIGSFAGRSSRRVGPSLAVNHRSQTIIPSTNARRARAGRN